VTSGLLLLDKPSGPTSHDLVLAVRRGAREKHVGHAGTLDPLATGLLILCLGSATRLSDFLRDKDKRYQARVRLGQTTDTYDADGDIVAESRQIPDEAAVAAALGEFRGAILQRPPAYSAIKRGGKKAYELARQGETVSLEARPIVIYSLALTEWQVPDFTLEVHCGSGVYVRSLAHDLGQRLGCGAHLTALRRTASGRFTVSQAVALADLEQAFADQTWPRLVLPPESAVADWPAVHLSAADAGRIVHGQPVPCPAPLGEQARAYNERGEFFAILRFDPTKDAWRPWKVLG
jgi:tRNA pseudouridine55 synthase